MNKRRCGILLHISSLASQYGIGDFGDESYAFADTLKAMNMSFWQVLPLNPTLLKYGNSPYSSTSAFAISPLLISPEKLMKDGLIAQADLSRSPSFSPAKTDYKKAGEFKAGLLEKAAVSLKKSKLEPAFRVFSGENAWWMEDYAVFEAFYQHFNKQPWDKWQDAIKNRNSAAMKKLTNKLAAEVEKVKIIQFLAWRQWRQLKEYCNNNGVHIIGDIPYYVHFNSADVFAGQRFFKLDGQQHPRFKAGVPPD